MRRTPTDAASIAAGRHRRAVASPGGGRARTDIQALRAIAVILVVVNHLWPEELSGGYVGVDVFFVISGYLITAHLLREIRDTDRVSLPRFYARRARRLLPAALLVSLASLLAALLLLPAERWQRVANEIFAATAYVQNWLLSASSVDYWAHDQFATPVQHYWSLSVEEQFYLLWPVTLVLLGWLFARTAKGRIADRPRVLATAIVILGSGSFALAMWQTAANRDAAYFNTFGRVWEFMLGGLVAACGPALAAWLAERARRHATVPQMLGAAQLLGYAAVFASAASFTPDTPFPGPWALLPALGTALVIASGPAVPRWSPARGLDWRPVQVLGDVSYSLYLWHWPLIVFAPFALQRTVQLPEKLLILLLSVLLAVLTKHLVEDPGRTRLFAGAHPVRTLLATAGSVAVVGALTVGTAGWAGTLEAQRAETIAQARDSACFGAEALESGTECGDPFGPALFPSGGDSESPWAARNAPECAEAPKARQILSGDKPSLVQCDFSRAQEEASAAAAAAQPAKPDSKTEPKPDSKPGNADRSGAGEPLNVWLVGDSHAEHWQAAVIDLARGNQWHLTRVAYGGCPTVPVSLARFEDRSVTPEKRASCLKWSTDLNARITRERPDVVLVSNFASAERVDDGSDRPEVEQLADGIRRSLLKWTTRGTEVVVIRDTPTGGEQIGADCSATRRAQTDRGCVAPKDEVLPKDPMVQAVKMLDRPRLKTVSLSSAFCSDDTCSGVVGGVPVYYDEDHLAASYARSLAPALGEELGEKLDLELRDPVPESP